MLKLPHCFREQIVTHNGQIFAIATADTADIDSLVGYTDNRRRIYFDREDKVDFFNELGQVTSPFFFYSLQIKI